MVSAAHIMLTRDPSQMKAIGNKVKANTSWDKVSSRYMKQGVHAKFHQNAGLCASLIATAGKHLVEANPYDSYWAIGRGLKEACDNEKSWNGANHLGHILDTIREELTKN